MISVLENKKCCGCSACADICPVGAIVMTADREGFLYPYVDTQKCTDCGLCEKVCPALELPKFNAEPEVYALQLKDNEALMRSQSGGAFWAIAEPVLEQGGVVYGAAFDENMKVAHCRAETVEDAREFQGTKYVQTDMRGVMKQVKADLKAGRKVLFTGTACHVAGLYRFLGKEYENLLTCELLCYGVPSPLLLEKFLQYWQKKEKAKISKFHFGYYNADEGYTWNDPRRERIWFANGKHYDSRKYIETFVSNWCLRPYCHTCPYAKVERVADFTMGDFWGVEKYTQSYETNRGVSVLLVNSHKAKAFMPQITERALCEAANLDDVKRRQPNLCKPAQPNKRRDRLMDKLVNKGYAAAHRTEKFYYFLFSLKQKVLRRQ